MIQGWNVGGELWTWREEEGVWLGALETEGRSLWDELYPPKICPVKLTPSASDGV